MSTERKPFHEVLVDLIDQTNVETLTSNLPILFKLASTNIPKGHDEIVRALERKMAFGLWKNELELMKREVLAQKTEAEAKKANNVGDKTAVLMTVIEKIIAECDNIGSGAEFYPAIDRLHEIAEAVSQAKNKAEFDQAVKKLG